MLAKSKFNSIEVIISKTLIDSEQFLIKHFVIKHNIAKNKKYDGYQRGLASVV